MAEDQNTSTLVIHQEESCRRRQSTNASIISTPSKQLRLSEPKNGENFIPKPFRIERILIKIYHSLLANDKKNFKLASRNWFYACHGYEKICLGSEYFSTPNKIHEVLPTFSKSLRPTFHFEFYCAHFIDTIPIATFWRTCGPKIVTLKLHHCEPSIYLIQWISTCCPHLRVLEWSFITLIYLEELVKSVRRILPFISAKNESLETLRVMSKFKWRYSLAFWIRLQETMLDLFPNLLTFDFCEIDLFCWIAPFDYMTHPQMTHAERQINIMDETKFWKKLQKCFACNNVKNIAMNFLFSQDFLYKSLTNITGLTKITEISISSDLEVNKASFLEFAYKQQNLRKITCISNHLVQRSNLDFLVLKILKIRSLQEFQLLLFASTVDWNNEWSLCLSASNIENIRIMCSDITFSRGSSDSVPPNTTLSRLIIHSKYNYCISNSVHITNLLKMFPNMKYLYLRHANEMILESICKNQVKLQYFFLENVDIGDMSTFWNPILSHNKLGDLRVLELPQNLFETRCMLTEKNYFDRLTALHITGQSAAEHFFRAENLEVYRRMSRTLEALWIDCFIMDRDSQYESVRKLVEDALNTFVSEQKTLKVLNLLYLGQRDFYNWKWLTPQNKSVKNNIVATAEYEYSFALRVFDQCPSLQIFVHRGAFVYDAITKSVHHFKQDFQVLQTEIEQRYFCARQLSK